MKKILIVDDTVVNLKMAERVLREIPETRTIPVPSGKRALDFAAKNRPDVIFLDIMMPEMDGFETLAALRQLDGMADVPVVFLTGDTDTETKTKVEAAQVAGMIMKPFNKEELLAIATRLLEGED